MTILNFNWHFFFQTGLHYVEEAGPQLGLMSVPISKFQVLGAQAPATMPGHCYFARILQRSPVQVHTTENHSSEKSSVLLSPRAAHSQFRARTDSKACLRRVNWFQKYPFEAQVVLAYSLFLYALWSAVLTWCGFNSVNTMVNSHHLYAGDISFTENHSFPFITM